MQSLIHAFQLEVKIAKLISNDEIDPKRITYPIFIRTGFSEKRKSWACTFHYILENDTEWYEAFMIDNYPNSGEGDTIEEALMNAIENLCKSYGIKIKGYNS